MNRMRLYEEIGQYFNSLKSLIKSYTKGNLYDINIHCENFFLNLLNLMYGWNLKNLNVKNRNEPGVDLIDYGNKIVIQVSATCRKDKVQSSLDNVKTEKYGRCRFVFISIVDDAEKLRDIEYELPEKIIFEPKEDILDLDMLLKEIDTREISQLEKIYEMVRKELDPYSQKKFSLGNFKNMVIENVKNMGERYSKDLDIELEMYGMMHALEQNQTFKDKFRQEFEKMEECFGNLMHEDETEEKRHAEITGILKEIHMLVDVLLKEPRSGKVKNQISQVRGLCDELEMCAKRYFSKGSWKYFSIGRAIQDYNNYLLSAAVQVFQHKNVLMVGGAGMGKSHFMAHHALRRVNEGKVSLLLLGQLFRDRSHPYLQMKKQLALPEDTDMDEVFEAMNQWGESQNENAILFLDALNEGAGIGLWEDYLNGMVEGLKKYPYISLILSIRDVHFDKEALEIIAKENDFAIVESIGFSDVDQAAAKFFSYYNVPYSIHTSIMGQFRNPLFLKLYCKGYRKENENVYGIERILEQYFYKVDKDIRKRNDVRTFPKGENMVQMALEVYMGCRIERSSLVPYDMVYEKLIQKMKVYDMPFNLLDELISENLLVGVIYEGKSCVYMTYDMFDNYLIAKRIVDESKKNFKDCKTLVSDIFSENNKYCELVHSDSGVQEALAVILPDLDEALSSDECEVFYWPGSDKCGSYYELGLYEDAYYKSMLWRKPERIKKVAHSYVINNCFVKIGMGMENEIIRRFFETVLQTVLVKDHIYNARFLFEFLSGLDAGYFQRWWTSYISHGFHEDKTFRTLLSWAWNCEINGVGENAEDLCALADTMAWFLASLNHEVRDLTMKALMRIYRGNHELMKRHLQQFRFVKDMYILEGIAAAVYGGMLNSAKTEKFGEIGEVLYGFYVKNPVCNIMIRSYVENIFSYLSFLQIESPCINFAEIVFPAWEYNMVDEAEIEKIKKDGMTRWQYSSAFEILGIDDEEWREETLYEHNCLIRNLRKDVEETEMDRTEEMYLPTSEVIDRIPSKERKNIINMVIKEVFDMGYHYLMFQDRDCVFSEKDEDSIEYKCVKAALEKVLDIYFSNHKKVLDFPGDREAPFEGIWQLVFYRRIDPTMDFFSRFDEKDPAEVVYKFEELMNAEKMFRIKSGTCSWILINEIQYLDMEHQRRHAGGYLVSNEKLQWFQGILESEERTTFSYCMEDLYFRELYWAPAYEDIQRKHRETCGLPNGVEMLSENYVWDLEDGSMRQFVSFSVVSKYLMEELKLERRAGSLTLYKDGETAVKSMYEETYTDILYLQETYLSDYLKRKKKSILWAFQELEGKFVYVIYDGADFRVDRRKAEEKCSNLSEA